MGLAVARFRHQLARFFSRTARTAGFRVARRLRSARRMDRRKNSRPRLHRFRALARGGHRTTVPAYLAFSRECSAESRAGAHRAHLDESLAGFAAPLAAWARTKTQP